MISSTETTFNRFYLGELHVATVVGKNGKYKIISAHAACAPIIEKNEYDSYQAAKECVEHLVPVPCREYIRDIE